MGRKYEMGGGRRGGARWTDRDGVGDGTHERNEVQTSAQSEKSMRDVEAVEMGRGKVAKASGARKSDKGKINE